MQTFSSPAIQQETIFAPFGKALEAAEVHNVITCGLDHLAEGHTADVVITDGAADLHGLPGFLRFEPCPDVHADIGLADTIFP